MDPRILVIMASWVRAHPRGRWCGTGLSLFPDPTTPQDLSEVAARFRIPRSEHSLLGGCNCVGDISAQTLLFTAFHSRVWQEQIPHSRDKYFRAKMFARKGNISEDASTILIERNKCNQHIFALCFQVENMSVNAPQNIFKCKKWDKHVQSIWVKALSLKILEDKSKRTNTKRTSNKRKAQVLTVILRYSLFFPWS